MVSIIAPGPVRRVLSGPSNPVRLDTIHSPRQAPVSRWFRKSWVSTTLNPISLLAASNSRNEPLAPLQWSTFTAVTSHRTRRWADIRQHLTIGIVVTGTLRNCDRHLIVAQLPGQRGRGSPKHWHALTALTAGRACPWANSGQRLTIGLIEAFALR